jgi:RNA polymerase sigma factor (sigma-70 family)
MASMAEQAEDFGAAGSLLRSWSDEAELVERAKTQPEAFGHLYDRYYSVVLNYVFRRTLDVAMAEELTSNTFFNALRGLGGYENRGKFLAWLYRIAGNEIRLNWRARRKQHEGEARWRAELRRVRFATDRAIATEEVEEQAR